MTARHWFVKDQRESAPGALPDAGPTPARRDAIVHPSAPGYRAKNPGIAQKKRPGLHGGKLGRSVVRVDLGLKYGPSTGVCVVGGSTGRHPHHATALKLRPLFEPQSCVKTVGRL